MPKLSTVREPSVFLVSGATGLVGRRLVASLLRDGAVVRALTRDLRAASGALDPRTLLLRWNGVHAPVDAVSRAKAVVHLAGEPIFGGRLGPARRRRILASRVDSTRSLVKAIGALPEPDRPETLVCASAVGFYGDRGDEALEEDATAGHGFLAELCRDWEAAALAAEEHGVRAVTLRIGIVLAREGGALPLLTLPFRLGLGGRLGSGHQWFPWIHADDLVGLIHAVVRDPEFRGAVNAVAPEPVRNVQLTRALARRLHRPAVLSVPAIALRVALGELSNELLGSRRVVPRRALDRGFGFQHRTIESALEAELRR